MGGINVPRWIGGGVVAGIVGPGVRTAVIVSIALFLGGYLTGLIYYGVIGLFSSDLLVKWGVQGLIETIVAGIAGAWVYKE